MSKTILVARILNAALLLLLVASVAGFLSFANAYGVFLASVTALLAWGVFKNNSKAYFATAVWGLACYQLAKQGYEFQALKRFVMMAGMLVIPIALFLHETLGKQSKNAQKSDTHSTNDQDLR
ncbi:MAG TPA: hypothetical protein VN030_08695 [Cellvibrio sp.]|nr:hypothetical protein [Cellvibrio sp.]